MCRGIAKQRRRVRNEKCSTTVKSPLPRQCLCSKASKRGRNCNMGYLNTCVGIKRHEAANKTWTKGTNFEAEHNLGKFKRSLSLLGFDFDELWPKKQVVAARRTDSGPTVATRVLSRSISSERLVEEVRGARRDGRIDDDRRRILARAAYEEWYFQRVGDAKRKMKRESAEKRELRKKLEKESQIKDVKAKAEFQKWLKRKEVEKRNEMMKKSRQSDVTLKTKLITRQVEQQKAYDNWQKKKEKEIRKQKAEKLKEEEKKLQIERNKKERKATAENVFLRWKQKVEEKKKEETRAAAKSRKKENHLTKKMMEKKSQSQKVFLTWKNKKDNELKEKRKLNRMALAFVSRKEVAEERMAQAQTAFELWLDSVEKRSRKKFQGQILQPIKPWIPV